MERVDAIQNIVTFLKMSQLNLAVKVIIFAVMLVGLVIIFINIAQKQILMNKAVELSREISVMALNERKKAFIKTDPLTAFQNKFVYSRISNKFTLLSAQLYIFLMILFSAIAFLVSLAVSHNLVLAIVAATCIAMGMLSIIYIMAEINYKKTDNELLEFLNLLGNYSLVNGEITKVLQLVGRSMQEPIRSCIYEFSVEAQQGDVVNALRNMRQKIEHPKFKEIIRDIEVSLRYSTSYTDMISSNRKLIKNYITAKEERKTIARQGNIQMFLIVCCLIIMLFAMGILLKENIWVILFEQTIGHICIYMTSFILMIYFLLSKRIVK